MTRACLPFSSTAGSGGICAACLIDSIARSINMGTTLLSIPCLWTNACTACSNTSPSYSLNGNVSSPRFTSIVYTGDLPAAARDASSAWSAI